MASTAKAVKNNGLVYKKSYRHFDGFTIPELLIATAIFSVILMVAMASFIQIGRMFYKGITISQTKDTAQNILDSVSADLQYADTAPSSPSSGGSGSTAYSYICLNGLNGSRYTYMPRHEVDLINDNWTSPTQRSFGLLHDRLTGHAGCGDPFNTSASNYVPLQNPVELLGNKMRLSTFSINLVDPAHPNYLYYNVNVYVAYGDDDVLNTTAPATTAAPVCVSDLKSSEFCSVIGLKTIVSRNFSF